MNRKIAIVIGLQAFLIIMLFWVLVFYSKDEYEAYTSDQDEEIETPNRISSEQGATVVTLSPAIQAQSEIKTSQLASGKKQNILSAYGNVLSIDTLIDLRTRYLAAKAEANVVKASLNNSKLEYQRLSQLNQDNRNVSDRAVIAAEAQYKSDQAKLEAAETAARNLRDAIRQQWGEVLTVRATEQASSKSLEQLLNYREVLIQITLPFNTAEPKADSSIRVSPTGTQSKSVDAIFISASPRTDSTIQGKTYFYRAPSDNLRTGMRVSVQWQEPGRAADGVIVPNTAVIWYGGKAWVYKKEAEDKFKRLPISTEQETNGGWFNAGNLQAGEEVVTNGAQLLLSEEFKYQIKNENED